jgi:hypothetical protein
MEIGEGTLPRDVILFLSPFLPYGLFRGGAKTVACFFSNMSPTRDKLPGDFVV